ncbi:MAG TPA: A/G-specific adenine glycosylase, partial [Casimicrobiaceae bacterium]|nr:A/G-specific adenine glycosylase [Casimicrobiaceae bacterium]
AFARDLIVWQKAHGRHDLPWQGTRDAYAIWVSEIMLQQTQVATVLPYFTRFVADFPTVDALAAAPLSRVLERWSGLGYYRRAHHLHAAARIVVDRHAGRVPSDAATLATLPGIGRSTAAAIAVFASGERAAILDGNVKRVLARHRGIEGWTGAAPVEDRLWHAAESSLPAQSDIAADPAAIGGYTQGMMDLGATICVRVQPLCDACPVRADCVAFAESRVGALPSPRPRKTLPRRAVTLLLLERDGAILLEQRPPLGIWGGLWSFPEIPVERDVSSHVSASYRVAAEVAEHMPPITHVFTHFALTMHPVRIRVARETHGVEMPGVQWIALDRAGSTAVPAPIRKLLASLRPGPSTEEGSLPRVAGADATMEALHSRR